jgi:GT2 family glycosyltransferase
LRRAQRAERPKDTFLSLTARPAPRLSVVVVTFNSRGVVGRTLAAVREQIGPRDELVVVDNASTDGTPDAVAELAPDAKLVRGGTNLGFAAGANAGAARASGELLVFLNPDAVLEPGFAEAIRRPLVEARGWAAWMGLVTAEERSVVNTSGGVVHFTGIAWAGEAGRPAGEVDPAPREVAFVSGACLAIPRETWERAGGFPADYFMYCEDVDLSLRLRLAGERLGVEPAARVDHDYEFAKGGEKWRLLERNRWATLVRTYPTRLLVLLAPALLAAELAVVVAAARGGWLRQKLLASADGLRALPRLARERRELQAGRRATPAEFAAWLTPDLSSAYLGVLAGSRPLRTALRAYWRAVLALL